MIATLLAPFVASVALQDTASGLLEPVEIRAMVVRQSDLDVLGDATKLGAAMQRLSEIGFDAVVPMAWERGRTLFASPSLVAAGHPESLAFPGRDVLSELVFEAHRAGLEVLVGIDGTWPVGEEPATKLALAKDRLDVRDPKVRAAARGFALDAAKAAEVDGFVLWNGLTSFAPGAADAKAADEAAREFAAWREDVRAYEKSIVVGWAATDAAYAWPADAKQLDFVVFPRDAKAAPAALTAWAAEKPGRAALWTPLDAPTTAESFAAELAAARAKPYAGEIVGSYAALAAGENALADVLNQGFEAPYYARATLPWRGGVAWRPVCELVELVNDSGTFEDVDAEIPYSTLAPGPHGNASWALAPDQGGIHELWVYLHPGEAEIPALPFVVTTDPRRAVRVTIPAHVPRGWTRVARTTIANTRKEDVLRLEIPAGNKTPLAIGPLVAIPRRRPDSR